MRKTYSRNGFMQSGGIALTALLLSAPVWGAKSNDATISTTLTVQNATGAIGATGIVFNGQASLTNIGNGTLSGTIPLTPTGSNLVGSFVITLSAADKINMNVSVPTSALAGGALTGSATVTGGTGIYAGATGSFPTLTGSASVGVTSTLSITGAGTITTGGAVGPTPPAITDILDAASNPGDIAQGSIFVIKGTTLSASGYTPFSFPLPTTSGGVKITFTSQAGGAGTDAYLVYLYNVSGVNQLAAIVPSTLPVGNYNVTVTSNGTTSAASTVKVVARKLALVTADSTGSGMAVVQNFVSQTQLDIGRLTTFTAGGLTFSPSKPGQTLILWGTGLGKVSGADNTASPGVDFLAQGVNIKVIVGGVSITPLYAGRAPGLAGADQINFTLPANIPTGCTVPLQVSVDGVLSPATFIAIAPNASATACVQPGFTTQQLSQYDQGASYTVGAFSLSQISETLPQVGTVKLNTASGQFLRYTGLQLAGLAQYQAQVSTSGACTVIHAVSGSSQTTVTGNLTGLDAGNITLNGPAASSISNLLFAQDKFNNYSLALATEGLPIGGGTGTIVAGTYALAGAGGKDVGKFNASVTVGSPLTITGGLPAIVNRGAGLTLNWTGGNTSDIVQIVGSSSTITGTVSDSWVFICTTTAGAKTFTVPASILTQLPVSTLTAGVANGFLEVISGVTATFTAPLTAGGNIDAGAFIGLVGIGALPAYQ